MLKELVQAKFKKFIDGEKKLSTAQFLCFVKMSSGEIIKVEDINDPDTDVYMMFFVSEPLHTWGVVTDLGDEYAFCDIIGVKSGSPIPRLIDLDINLSNIDLEMLKEASEL